MQRILIIGSGGTGKSVCARQLGHILKLPVFHLDCYFWQPNWVQTPKEEWLQQLQILLEQDRWIIDGNYSRTLVHRLQYADTVVFLDYPTRISLYRALKRQIFYRNRRREDITEGCKERLEREFLLWIYNFRKNRRPGILELLAKHPNKQLIHLIKPKDLKKWLFELAISYS
ncbi:MAG: AAA family ATPase [Promethearchaeota archaeon]|nr:MAG: AAA family ATPase [Candidatus Lokiarchaeota archaeon]